MATLAPPPANSIQNNKEEVEMLGLPDAIILLFVIVMLPQILLYVFRKRKRDVIADELHNVFDMFADDSGSDNTHEN